MSNDSLMLRALNEAIWLRDNAARLDKENLFRIIEDIGEYEVFSARQISALTRKKVSHQTVSRLCAKTDRTGGRLNIETLDDIRECFYSRIKGRTNYDLVRKVVESGTSQGMLAKLSGINQARISKNVR